MSDSDDEDGLQTDSLAFLEGWYAEQCNGDWEHSFGIEIGSLDNPGWRVEINLEGTSWEGWALEHRGIERSANDWLNVWSDGLRWEAAYGPRNLGEVLDAFRSFASAS